MMNQDYLLAKHQIVKTRHPLNKKAKDDIFNLEKPSLSGMFFNLVYN